MSDNNIVIKIHKGTGQQTGTSLCRSCQYSLVLTDARGEQIRCRMDNRMPVRGNVYECNAYYNAALPSLDDMYRSAWTLRTEKNGRGIGFTPPKEREDGTPLSRI